MMSVLEHLLFSTKSVIELGTKTNTHKVSLIHIVCVHLFVNGKYHSHIS